MSTITLEQIETAEQPQSGLKFALKRDVFLNALILANRSVSTRSTLPILATFLIEAHGECVSISATNLETGIRLSVDALVDGEGICAIAAKTLLDCVKRLPKDSDITIEVVGERFVLACGKRVIALNYWRDASEFPAIPYALDSEPVTMLSDVLRQSIKEIQFAADDYSRPVYASIGIHIKKNAINLVAADEFRMAIRSLPPIAGTESNVMLLVPISTMRMLVDVLPKDTEVAITWNKDLSQVIFQADALTVVSRLVEGRFPDYSQALPKQHATVFTLGHNDLFKIIKALLPFAKDRSNMLNLFYGGEAVRFFAENSNRESVSDELAAIIEGEDGHIIFNILDLSDVLKAVTAECFTFFLSGEARPAVIVPLGRDDYRYVLMPMSPNR